MYFIILYYKLSIRRKNSRSRIFVFHYDYFFLFVFDRYIIAKKFFHFRLNDKKKKQVEKYMYK